MFQDVIIEQNPHWTGQQYPIGIERSYFSKLLSYLETGMIISVTGVRRAGKSTMLKQVINHLVTQKNVPPKNIFFLNLEHPYFVSFSKEVSNLQKVFEEYIKIASPTGKIYCLLDEIQYFNQ